MRGLDPSISADMTEVTFLLVPIQFIYLRKYEAMS